MNVREVYFMENKVITFDEVEKRLKNKKIEDWTDDDVFDRYVGYGNYEECNDIKVQRLFIKHYLTNNLIYSVSTIITDKKVVERILSDELIKENDNYKIISGKIQNIRLEKDNKLPEDMSLLIINFIEQKTNKRYEIKYFYMDDDFKYKNELENNIGNDLIAVCENMNLCCFLK